MVSVLYAGGNRSGGRARIPSFSDTEALRLAAEERARRGLAPVDAPAPLPRPAVTEREERPAESPLIPGPLAVLTPKKRSRAPRAKKPAGAAPQPDAGAEPLPEKVSSVAGPVLAPVAAETRRIRRRGQADQLNLFTVTAT